MVDLVKIRKKAKEKREQQAGSPDNANVSLPASDPAAAGKTPATAPAPSAKKAASREEKKAAGTAGTAETTEPKVAPPATGTRPAVVEEQEPRATERLEEFKRSAGLRVGAAGEGFGQRVEEQQLELLTFAIGAESYAISIEKIVEIIPPQNPTHVPNAPASVVGVISLRGTIVTILDVRSKLGHPASARGADSRVIVVDNKGETAGFVVDRVLRVIKIDPAKIESHPVVTPAEQSDHILGVFQHGKSLSIYLDLERLMQE